MMKQVALGLLVALTLGCNGVGEDAGDTTMMDESWVVGPIFEGYYGLSVGEMTSVRYYILHEDGSVERAATSSCEPNEASAFGTWTQTAADEVEIHTNEDSWPGNPNLDFIRLQRTDDCQALAASEVRIDGSLSTKGVHPYSRGLPCLNDCDGSGDREIVECADEVNPCE